MPPPSDSSPVRVAFIDDDSGLVTVMDRRLGALRWQRELLTYAAGHEQLAALRLHAERMHLGMREQRVAGSFMSTHPAVPVIEVPALPDDVHDLAGLRRIGESFMPGYGNGARS